VDVGADPTALAQGVRGSSLHLIVPLLEGRDRQPKVLRIAFGPPTNDEQKKMRIKRRNGRCLIDGNPDNRALTGQIK
jgi:hypothetical protein